MVMGSPEPSWTTRGTNRTLYPGTRSMSITSRSNRQPGWLPVRIADATGTGGTVTVLLTVTGPDRQPPGQLCGGGVVTGGALVAGRLDWPAPGGAAVPQAAAPSVRRPAAARVPAVSRLRAARAAAGRAEVL